MRVGVVGSGSMGARHIESWQRLGADVLVWSPTPAHRDRLAARAGIVAAADLTSLARGADVVDICTPTDSHAAIALAALGSGRPVVCEKPLARTVTEAADLVRRFEAAGVPLLVAHVLRYFDVYASARNAVRAGEIGAVRELTVRRVVDPPAPGSWLWQPERSGGVLLDLMVHDLDFARWVLGEVRAVRAECGEAEGTVRGAVWLTHVNGATSYVLGQWGGATADEFEIMGSAGRLRSAELVRRVSAQFDAAARAFDRQFADFSAGLETHAATRVSAADGVEAVRIALAAAESQRTGRIIEL
jgi:myo-inositol 2-dehydrogenase/D-chiro-inositol 1-dehydrogenase